MPAASVGLYRRVAAPLALQAGGSPWISATAGARIGRLTLAALAAGAEHVLSAHLEIEARGSGPLVRCLGRCYELVADGVAPAAALSGVLRDPALRDRPLYSWAALAVVGTHAGGPG